MKLDDFRTSRGLTYSELAELVGAKNTNAAWRWCQGEAPERLTADRISAATGGLVTIEELLYPDGVSPGARVARDATTPDTTAPPEAQPDAPGDAPAPQGVNDDNAATTAAGDRRAA